MTVLARKYWFITGIVIALVCMGAFISYAGSSGSEQTVRVRGRTFSLEVLSSDSDRKLGLSGRDSIAANHAVLFEFSEQASRCFWMKDMKFPIDMIWLDQDRRVTAIERSVDPSTYPSDFCHEGMYVVEWNDDVARSIGLVVGDRFEF